MATPTFVLLFAAGLIVAVAVIGYIVLVLIDKKSSRAATALTEGSATSVERRRPATL